MKLLRMRLIFPPCLFAPAVNCAPSPPDLAMLVVAPDQARNSILGLGGVRAVVEIEGDSIEMDSAPRTIRAAAISERAAVAKEHDLWPIEF
jgi:hypothetical protein